MDEKPVTADVVVACVAGFGAWAGIFVQHAGDAPTYAAEIFGPGSDEIKVTYPGNPGPWVTLTFDNDGQVWVEHDDGDESTTDSDDDLSVGTAAAVKNQSPPVPENSVGTITFMLHGAVFGDAVTLSDLVVGEPAGPDAGADADEDRVVGLESDGRAGDSMVTFRIDGGIADGDTFTLMLPKLKGISGSAVKVTTVTVAREGGAGFPTGPVDSFVCKGRTAKVDAESEVGKIIGAKLNDNGTITGRVVPANGVDAADPMAELKRCNDVVSTPADEAAGGKTVLMTKSAVKLETVSPEMPKEPQLVAIDIDERSMLASGDSAKIIGLKLTTDDSVLQADGTGVGAELSGDVTVAVTGTRNLFGADDQVIVKSGESADMRTSTKGLNLDGTTGQFVGSALPVIFSKATQYIDIHYMPGGKDELAHGAEIEVKVGVDFARDTAMDEPAQGSTTVLEFAGVSGELKAYAIAHAESGKGDRANVRVRCEDGVPNEDGESMCRVFLECWDDMGMRSFGESKPIYEGAVDVLSSMEIENDILTLTEPASSRLSCRVLATGAPSVQTLVRDGHSMTLVNNTYVEDE